MGTVCNRSSVKDAQLAWAQPGGRDGSAEAIWASGRRLTVAANACTRPFGPAGALVLRGWYAGGQGYDIGADWEAQVSFAPPATR
jgi:hypothetical protein